MADCSLKAAILRTPSSLLLRRSTSSETRVASIAGNRGGFGANAVLKGYTVSIGMWCAAADEMCLSK